MFDLPIELIVAVVIGISGLVMGILKALEAVAESRAKVAKILGARKNQVDRLRRAARTSLNLKRSMRDVARHRDGTELELEEAQAKLQAAEAIDHRLFVLDDRRTKVDQEWVALVRHANFLTISHGALPQTVTSWQTGRRFMVFALDPEKAHEKVLARFPERLGYGLISLEIRKPPKIAAEALMR